MTFGVGLQLIARCLNSDALKTAAYLVDHILPRVPVRQWVLSFPIPLRILHRAIHAHLIKQTHLKREAAASGAITLIQRFGSAANLNTQMQGKKCLVKSNS